MCTCTGQYLGDLPTAAKIANSSNYLPVTPSTHISANLIAAITACFNKQVSDGKKHKIFPFFGFISTLSSMKQEDYSMNLQQGTNKLKSQ